MADTRATELIELGNKLYNKRDGLLTLWQEIAENFYPERADFTMQHVLGEDFADHLMDSYPTLLRRELGNSISSMLRPRDRQWFKATTLDEGRDQDVTNAAYLEYANEKLRRLMYDSRTSFVRTTKEGDHDFVTFGQAVLSVEESANRDHLFYRSFHLRDCAWLENDINEVDHLHRKDKMTARKMKMKFGDKVLDKTVKEACKKNPGQEFNTRCVVLPSGEYDYTGSGSKRGGKKLPFVVVYLDADNGKILKEMGMPDFPYVVPRWHTVSGWQYAFAPTTVIALPDARLAQMMARIILEAGEKAVDPPIVAVEEAVREVNLAAGAITWADLAFDGKLKEAVQPIAIESNMQVAFAMRQDMREMLQKAWFIDKLQMPAVEGSQQMTAYEVGIRQSEFVRNLLPLFEPMEIEYNTRLLDKSFTLLRNMGAFPAEEVPEDLLGADVAWAFESPVQESSKRLAVSQFGEAMQLIGAAAQLGVSSNPVDLDKALSDAIRGTGAPSKWMKPAETIKAENAQQAEEAAAAQALAEVQAVAGTAGMAADASQKIGQAMLPPQPAPQKAKAA